MVYDRGCGNRSTSGAHCSDYVSLRPMEVLMSCCLCVVVNNVPDAHGLLLYGAEFMHNSCMYVRISEFISCYPFACNGWEVCIYTPSVFRFKSAHQENSSVLAQG